MNALQELGITKRPFLMIINGQTGSGKSHFLQFLMREINKSNEHFDFGIVTHLGKEVLTMCHPITYLKSSTRMC